MRVRDIVAEALVVNNHRLSEQWFGLRKIT
jgi:hypothetical protein